MRRALFTFTLWALLTPSWALGQALAGPEAKLWSSGQLQIEAGQFYVRGRSRVIDDRLPPLRSDVALSSVGLWYGLSDRIQFSATLPYVAANSTWEGRWTGGLGDIEGQFDLQVRGDGLDSTALTLELGTTAPTGDDAVGGMGWRAFAGLRAFKRFDPILQFGEVAYAHGFEQRFHGSWLFTSLK